MIGASRNSLMLERLADRFGWGPQPTMLDVGGGHGFLGLELAAKRWTVVVADHDPAKTELLGPWLARLSPRPLAIEYRTLSMEDLAAGGIPGQPSGFHVVTFFGSLLFARRNRVASLLRACWERLVPGGALIIREMVRQTAGEHLHGFRFERDELLRLVEENAAPPGFVSVVDGSPMTEFHAGTSALLAAKPGGGANSWRASEASTCSLRAERDRNGDTG
jgi:2-polyprenyl-3-methyl-5-hydroxy-6-metoxy-1,4-benzoquinol methylase